MGASRFLASLAGLALLAAWPGPSCSAPLGYRAVMRALKAADATERVRVVKIGRSVEGRAIPMAAIGAEDAPVRVLAICRQHGNEPISTNAAMHLIARAARGDAALAHALNGVLLMIIPMANPDGAELGTRTNARGVDLNRDWNAPSQPETKAIARLYKRLAPQVVLDEHEWTVEDHIGSNSLESVGDAPVAAAVRAGALGVARQAGVAVRAFAMPTGADTRLAHRHFGRSGAAAFLLETSPNQPMAARLALYERLTARIGSLAADAAPEREASMTVLQLTPLFRPAEVKQVDRPSLPYGALASGAATLLLVCLLGRPRRRAARTAGRSPLQQRALRGDEDVDLAARLARRRTLAASRAE